MTFRNPIVAGLSATALLATTAFAGGGGVDAPRNILINELCVTPTANEFVELYNASNDVVDLTNYYLNDATFSGGDQYYYHIVDGGGGTAGGGGFGDFVARFPAGTLISPGQVLVVSMSGSDGFFGAYGKLPDLELWDDAGAVDGVPQMLEATPGSIGGQGGLTNGGEFCNLFYWDGASDLVVDIDYTVWGDKVEAVDKTGIAKDGPDGDSDTTTYADDTAIVDQEVVAGSAHSSGDSFTRVTLSEGTETNSGGNGQGGHDETSENATFTWANDTASPCALNAGQLTCHVTPNTAGAVTLDINGATASSSVLLLVSANAGQSFPTQCPGEGVGMDLVGGFVIGLVSDGLGSISVGDSMPAGLPDIYIQAVDVSACRLSNTSVVNTL